MAGLINPTRMYEYNQKQRREVRRKIAELRAMRAEARWQLTTNRFALPFVFPFKSKRQKCRALIADAREALDCIKVMLACLGA